MSLAAWHVAAHHCSPGTQTLRWDEIGAYLFVAVSFGLFIGTSLGTWAGKRKASA